MSDTPRTDGMIVHIGGGKGVIADFARTLERELTISEQCRARENAAMDAALSAARREGKESTNNNNQQIQSKEQESSASNTKLGGESVGLDHRVTSPIQSEPKT